MKALTITFHTAKNYGAVLQCYALQKALHKYFDEVETIDFNTSEMKYSILPKGKGIKGIFKKLLALKNYKAIKQKHQKYDDFVEKYIKKTKHYGSIDELRANPPEASITITGSDQVFNPSRREDERQAYYLDFPCRCRVSYAASFGNSILPEEKKEEIRAYLNNFELISVRENYSINMINELNKNFKVNHTMDPVFLLGKENWIDLEEEYVGLPEKYILCFPLRESKKVFEVAKELAKKTGLPIVIITARTVLPIKCEYKLYNVGPQNFLWLIDHCTYFVEDSFHATAFSIIFEKQFIFADDHKKSYERGRALLDMVGLSQAYNIEECIDNVEVPYDYSKVKEKLKEKIDESKEYLQRIYECVNENQDGMKDKRAGIITYSDSLNYGAQLQAFALKQAIEEQGWKANHIDHRPLNVNLYRKGKSINVIFSNLVAYFSRNKFKTRVKRTEKWRTLSLGLTAPCRTSADMKKLNEQFDVFITGSDQVWNCAKGINSNFYLDFVEDDEKKCAYAASFGIKSLPDVLAGEVTRRLKKYRYISVRETEGKNIIEKHCEMDTCCVCDPVFLLEAKMWKQIVSKMSNANPGNEKYIFVYSTQINPNFIKIVYQVKRKYKLPVVTVSWLPGCKNIKDLGPAEFVHYIMNAEMIITTSFHATAFSIIFHKKFGVIPHSSTGNRVTDILDRLNLTDHIMGTDWRNLISETDYSETEFLLKQYVEQSKRHLSNILNGYKNVELKNESKTIECVGELCTGCRVCEKKCPFQAIQMKEDQYGFIYPHIDRERCKDCGVCLKSCHVLKKRKKNIDDGAYGYAKKEELRSTSSSGGSFSAIVEHVAKGTKNLWVYGSIYDVQSGTVRQNGYRYPEYEKLRQSKYVFSDTCNTFQEVKEKLENEETVIYCGTPCQIGALKTYLNKSYVNLLTIDFICHGVPSNKFMKEHIEYVAGKAERLVYFRSKALGWGLHQYCLKVDAISGKTTYLKKAGKDFFFSHFLNNDCLRLGCYFCGYSKRHVADITLGDFWEIARFDKEFDDGKGISVMFCNTEKGKSIINSSEDEMVMKKLPCDYRRSRCGCDVKKVSERNNFLERLNQTGIKKMEQKFIVGRPLILIKKLWKKIM